MTTKFNRANLGQFFALRLLLPICIGICILTVRGVSADTITIEAEQSVFTAPLLQKDLNGATIVGTEIYETRYCGTSPADAAFQQVPNMYGNNPSNTFKNNEGTITFPFSISKPGIHIANIAAYTPSSASNSVFVKLDSDTWKLWDQVVVPKVATFQSLAFAPADFAVRTQGDFFCWNLAAGPHSFGIRWRELGVFIDKITITDTLPAINITAISGCGSGSRECKTAGGSLLSIETSAVCPDITLTIGGNLPCLNITMDPVFPNRRFTCVLPTGTGQNLDIDIASAGRTLNLPGALSYGLPTILSVSGCSSDDKTLGTTADCVPGTVITIQGTNLGPAGGSVSVHGTPCENVQHDPSTPNEMITCTLGTPASGASAGITFVQASMAKVGTPGSASFTGLRYKPKNILPLAIGLSLGLLAFFIALAFAIRYYVSMQRSKRARRRLLAPEPWRIDVAFPGTSNRKRLQDQVIYKGETATAYYLPAHVDPLALDQFAETAYVAALPALSMFHGASFTSRYPPAVITADAANQSQTLKQYMTSHLTGAVPVSTAVSLLADIARGCTLLYADSDAPIGIPPLNSESVVVISEPKTGKLHAAFAGPSLGTHLHKRFRGRVRSTEHHDVLLFGVLASTLLCNDYSDRHNSSNANSNYNSGGVGGSSNSLKITSPHHKPNVPTLSHRSVVQTDRSRMLSESGFGLSGRAGARSNRSFFSTTSSNKVLNYADLRFHDGVPDSVIDLVQSCLGKSRPTFRMVSSLLDAVERELVVTKLVEERTRELEAAYQRSDEILCQLIPAQFIEPLKRGERIPAKIYPDCSIFFCDVVGFTTISSTLGPEQVNTGLEELMGELDALAAIFGIYRVNTIGDAYFAISGAPQPAPLHAAQMAKFAFKALEAVKKIRMGGNEIRIRIGLHSGPVAGGIQGRRVPRFDVFGDSVNVASRMESTGVPGMIQITEETMKAIQSQAPGMYRFEPRKNVQVKGKGEMTTFILQQTEL